jgi:ribosomal protein S18 acetylase RimI-like enzyme
MAEISIAPVSATPQVHAALREILIEVVANGGSVSFMHPLAPDVADAFWARALAAAVRGERVVLGAFDGQDLVGTVTVLLDLPPNQPHRAEIAKLMTKVSHRGRGVARALMRAAERVAVERARTLLVLDTAEEGGAAALYESLGFTRAGVIPDFALKPNGGLTGTVIYWKRLGSDARDARNVRAETLMSPHAASGIGARSSASTTSQPSGPQISPTG